MKTLYILRHAKSSWNDDLLADCDRPLNQRGLNAAPFIGEVMAREKILPDIFISSPAKSTTQTALLVKEASGSNAAIQYDERIYEASVQALKLVISQIAEQHETALIIGHNPGMEGLIQFLTGSSESMPTAALASVVLDIKAWDKIAEKCGTLQSVIRPNDEMKTSL